MPDSILDRPLPSVPCTSHHQVHANGARFHVAEIGIGRPVVLLHGFPQHWYAWRGVATRLAPDHHLWAVDQRGLGWSSTPRTGYDLATRVDDLIAVLDQLGLEKVDLIGHQWGAWTGFFACLLAPDRFRHHLALGTLHPWLGPSQLAQTGWPFWLASAFGAPFLGRLVQRRLPSLTRHLLAGAANSAEFGDEALCEYIACFRRPGSARAGELLHRSLFGHDIPASVAGRFDSLLSVPTLLLAGELDPMVKPAVLHRTERTPSSLTLEQVPGAGHWLPEERPARVASAARDLFDTDRATKNSSAMVCTSSPVSATEIGELV